MSLGPIRILLSLQVKRRTDSRRAPVSWTHPGCATPHQTRQLADRCPARRATPTAVTPTAAARTSSAVSDARTDVPVALRPVLRAAEAELGDDYEQFARAAQQIVLTQFGSVSMLQRKMRLGFARATDLMNQLERHGVVGPAEGTHPREVLIPAR